MKLHEKTRRTNQGSPGSQELPAGKSFLLPHVVSVFPDNYPQAKDNKELYLEFGETAVEFSARCVVNEPTNKLYMTTLLYPHDGFFPNKVNL